MSAFSRNLCSSASRNLRSRSGVITRAVRPIALRTSPLTSFTSRAAPAASFSAMSSLKSAAPPVQSKREYDPEIKDIASYIHNTPIDSELAVCSSDLSALHKLTSIVHSSTLHDGSSSTPSAAVSRVSNSSNAGTSSDPSSPVPSSPTVPKFPEQTTSSTP